jgi:hypothetical protein
MVQKKPSSCGVDHPVDTVTILRKLWRMRLLVAVVAAFAILIGVFISYKLPSLQSRKYDVGVATARILVDTPASQVVDLSPKGQESLGERTTLLSSLMVDGEIKTEIARRAGLRPDQLIGINADAMAPDAAAPTPGRDSDVLSTQVTMISGDSWLPIIQIATQAPTKAGAQKLADAAVSGLRAYLDNEANAQAIPQERRLRVSGLGLAQARQVTRGPRLIFSILATVFLFIAGCGAILGGAWLIAGLRDQGDYYDVEEEPYDDAPYGAAEPEPAEYGAVWFDERETALVPTIAADGAIAPDAPVDGNGRR